MGLKTFIKGGGEFSIEKRKKKTIFETFFFFESQRKSLLVHVALQFPTKKSI